MNHPTTTDFIEENQMGEIFSVLYTKAPTLELLQKVEWELSAFVQRARNKALAKGAEIERDTFQVKVLEIAQELADQHLKQDGEYGVFTDGVIEMKKRIMSLLKRLDT